MAGEKTTGCVLDRRFLRDVLCKLGRDSAEDLILLLLLPSGNDAQPGSWVVFQETFVAEMGFFRCVSRDVHLLFSYPGGFEDSGGILSPLDVVSILDLSEERYDDRTKRALPLWKREKIQKMLWRERASEVDGSRD